MPLDKIALFEKKYNICLFSRDDWNSGYLRIWYTDVFKKTDLAEAGMYNRKKGKEILISLGRYATIMLYEREDLGGCINAASAWLSL